MKVYSEIYTNWILRPLAENSRNKIINPITINDTTYIEGFLDYKCFMMLDVITTLIVHVVYKSGLQLNMKDKLPNQYSKSVLDAVQQFSQIEGTSYFNDPDNLKQMSKYGNAAPANLSFSKIKTLFPFINYSNSEIERILRKISECVFSTKYKCTQVEDIKKDNVLVKRERVVKDYNLVNCRIFDIEVNGDNFSLKFLNPFGILFLQNIFARNLRVLNEYFYKLNEHPQNLYRFLNTVPSKKICIDVLSESMRLGESNNTLRNKRLEKWLNDLNENTFLLNGKIVDKNFVEWDEFIYPGKRIKEMDKVEKLTEEVKELKKAIYKLTCIVEEANNKTSISNRKRIITDKKIVE